MTDKELNDIFRCVPVHSSSPSSSLKEGPTNKSEDGPTKKNEEGEEDSEPPSKIHTDTTKTIANLEHDFESLSAPLKSHLLHHELTSKSKALIKSSLSTIRTAQHSLRSFTETSKARKALAERLKKGRLPQELCQCVMRIAVSKMRVRGLILGVEGAIRWRPVPCLQPQEEQKQTVSLPSALLDDSKKEDANGDCRDVVSELMQWYLQQQHQPPQSSSLGTTTAEETAATDGKSLLHHLFPEGHLNRRRLEPRTGEAHVHDEALSKERNVQQQQGNPSTLAAPAASSSSVASDSSDGISLDDLTCTNCLGSHASDTNDMLLCDGMKCYRAFHMQCLEPKLTLAQVQADEGSDWFCPLCTAHANLVHYAQIEYLGDDWEELMKAGSSSSTTANNGSSDNNDDSDDIKEWETAKDVFPEAEFEMRVAKKFKEDVMDEETKEFLEETLGIVTGASSSSGQDKDDGRGINNNNFGLEEEDDDEGEDDDFDQEEEAMDDCDSLAEDSDMEKQLLEDRIGKDELDALSVTSGGGSDNDDNDDGASSDEDDNGGSSSGGNGSNNNKSPRRSKRRRFTLPGDSTSDGNSDDDKRSGRSSVQPMPGDSTSDGNSDDDERSGRSSVQPNTDMGTLDVANIVRGKRCRSKVNYRKMADAMFGDESDEEAKGTKKEYTYKPKKTKPARVARKNDSDDENESESDNNEDSDNDDSPKKKKEKTASMNGKIESKQRRSSSNKKDGAAASEPK
eukprot:CAMPEP_0202031482 /NCGR_PEP_ID=MMETSP0905-20130828/65036_1 /ASSEMBLY_ACC=CAM_ASM_000554 /TAXON_ID=420261 /ORGANISM="Thalassiosira antarctica, Strain CCMP982" /LENGTH=737 /DNA_ID=CAMNT_0048595321 /DNA_START=13 /DNA_END=2226 /DNA_ORIENTATION=-